MDKIETCTKFQWRKVDPGGNLPLETENRFGCSATLLGHYIWVIGGYGVAKYSLLDLNQKAWINVPVTAEAFKFQLHSASLYEDAILLYGAKVEVEEEHPRTETRELMIFDLVLKEVEVIPTYGGKSRPNQKEAHTTDICEAEKLLVMFGGRPFPSQAHNQLYLLDLSSWTWSLPDSKGKAPSLRERHGSLMVGSKLFIYSGDRKGITGYSSRPDLYFVDIKRNEKLLWQQVIIGGDPKFVRIGAGLQYVGNGRAVIFGGYSSLHNSSDLLVVEDILSGSPVCHVVLSQRSSLYLCTSEPPSPREAPRIVLSQGKLIIIGGCGRDKSSYYELIPG